MTALLHWLLPARPPLLALVGVAVAFAGLALDLFVHLTATVHQHEHAVGFSLGEHSAHLVGLAGMVIALAGVVLSGLRRQPGSNR